MADTSANDTMTLCGSSKGVSVDQLFIDILNKMDSRVETQQMFLVFGVWVVVITIKYVLKHSAKSLYRQSVRKKVKKPETAV